MIGITYSCLEYRPSSISPSAGAIFEIYIKKIDIIKNSINYFTNAFHLKFCFRILYDLLISTFLVFKIV